MNEHQQQSGDPHRNTTCVLALTILIALSTSNVSAAAELDWQALPDLPDKLGVAGPFVGVHKNALIVAGGANFPRPVWDNDKVWRDSIHVLTQTDDSYEWHDGGKLSRPTGYGAAVSTADGVICIGGNNGEDTFTSVFALQWNAASQQIAEVPYPSLPKPCAFGQAVLIEEIIYLAGGQNAGNLNTAMNNFWSLDLSNKTAPTKTASNTEQFSWKELPACPGGSRAFNITAAQHNGYEDCVYIISGRRQNGDNLDFLTDVWEYSPKSSQWRQRADVPQPVLAGIGIGFGQSHIYVLGGDDGSKFFKADELKDDHPGFPKESFAYHTITNTWTPTGTTPQNHVTTVPLIWNNRIVIASGEVRPRVRTPAVWSVRPATRKPSF